MKTVIFLLGMFVVGAGNAATPYIGASIGRGSVTGLNDATNLGVGVDRQTNTFKLFGGARMNESLALEVAYEDLGAADLSYSSPTISIWGDWKARAISASVLGMAPVTEAINVFGRIGLAQSTVETNLRDSNGDSGSWSATDTGALFGFGAEYRMDRVFFRLEFSRYQEMGDSDTDRSEVDVVSVGMGMGF